MCLTLQRRQRQDDWDDSGTSNKGLMKMRTDASGTTTGPSTPHRRREKLLEGWVGDADGAATCDDHDNSTPLPPRPTAHGATGTDTTGRKDEKR
jgi:hypothetical protein